MRASLVLVAASMSLLFLVACDGGSGSNNNTIVDAPPVEPPVEPPTEPPFVSPADNAVTVDGKVWLQPADFTGYIFEQVKAVCPGPDGVCSGSLQGSTFDLTGYKWASIMDVSSLFNAYGVDPPFTEPFQRRNDDSAAIAMSQDFTISGEWCFGDCPFGFDFVMGIVRDEAPTGMPPYLPYVDAGDCIEVDDVDCEFSNTTGFDSDEVKTPDDGIGIWLWKPAESTGIDITDTVTVDGKVWAQVDLFTNLSWNDINAVCPEGACFGILNGHDMTGWTWAKVDDLNALFNHYVGSDVLGPGPDCYSEGHNTPWVDAFFDDGWRDHDFITGYVSVGGRLRDSADYIAFLADSFTPGMGSGGDGICTNETFTGINDPGTGAWFYRTP